jgi:preprotein translocase subunit SecB
MADEQPQGQAQAQSGPQKQLLLQRIYVKDLSFESPRAPAVFGTEATPQTQLNIKSSAAELGQDATEVTLTITVETKDQDQTIFLVELTQAGVFILQNYTPEERGILIGSYCPATLYPYAREAISDVITRGGFPQLLLQPINFDALYAQAQSQRAAEAAGAATMQPPLAERPGANGPGAEPQPDSEEKH